MKFPRRRYIKGKERYIDEFCVHDIDDMMETLGCVEEGKLLYYNFKRPFSDLDFGLFALASNIDINQLGTYVGKHKLIEVYVEHDIEWVGEIGGSNVKETETREIDDIGVVNNEVFLYESSSDEGGRNRRRKSIKPIRRAMENSEARISDPFYVYQKFTSSE
ncbi:unnamed protein product [Lactuca saligna]|uniref:Uncharacterized protein n=1 Tax=Lactuca saligna TaxID=75948 RepID=A0AA35YAS2_LACSI|nr:unnamed protein product [Lactuca saligna]